MHFSDAEATLEIIHVNLLECLEDLWNSPVHEMVDCHETDFLTQCEKEWNLVDKKMLAVKNTSL